MPNTTSKDDFYPPVSIGPAMQSVLSATDIGLALAVTHGTSINSNLLLSNGYKVGSVGLKSTKAGVLSVQRYIDEAGTVAQGAALTATLVANTANIVNITDGAPFASFKINVSNTDGSNDAVLSNVAVLLQAN